MSQETQTSYGGKFMDVRYKSPQNHLICVITLINGNFRWSKSSVKIISFIYSVVWTLGHFQAMGLNHETKIIIYNHMVVLLCGR